MKKLSLEELGRDTLSTYQEKQKFPITLVLDNLRSMHNVGAAFRTADAFMIERIVLCGITARPPHREIHKSALGATESVAWDYFETTLSCIENLKANGYRIIGVEQTDESILLQNINLTTQKVAYIFGNEVFGLDEVILPYLDACIEIPQFGTKHSLNVSVSIGVVLWHHVHGLLIK